MFSVLSEFAYEKLMKKPLTITDFSAVSHPECFSR